MKNKNKMYGNYGYPDFRYIPYVPNSVCSHIVLSERAKAGILSEVMLNDEVETGGVLLGYIKNSVWYIVECIDPGMRTRNTVYNFNWDEDYVNHLFGRVRYLYDVPLSILGFWHRHPGSMDYFSSEDKGTIYEHLQDVKKTGLLSMLVNIDPDFRMTFYHAYNGLMKVGYDIGDEYFPEASLKWVSEKELTANVSNNGYIKPGFAYNRIVPLEACDVSLDYEEDIQSEYNSIESDQYAEQDCEEASEEIAAESKNQKLPQILCKLSQTIEKFFME